MSKTFHVITYSTLVLYILFQQRLITGYDLMNDQLLGALDQAMAACGVFFHKL